MLRSAYDDPPVSGSSANWAGGRAIVSTMMFEEFAKQQHRIGHKLGVPARELFAAADRLRLPTLEQFVRALDARLSSRSS